MRHGVILMVGFFMLVSNVVFADMIEVQGRGVLNGKLISQDEEGVNFKDASGVTHRFSKAEVLYSDFESASFNEMSVSKKIHLGWVQFLEKVKKLPADYKAVMERLTSKGVKKMSKPLDRSVANERSSALSSALDTSGKAAAQAARKNLLIAKEISEQRDEQMQNLKVKKGRFVSLED